MFGNKIVGVNKGVIQTSHVPTLRKPRALSEFAPRSASTKVTATLGSGIGTSLGVGIGNINSSSLSVNTQWSTEYQYMLTGILGGGDPLINDPLALGLMYRDIYLLDSTAGSAVDIQSTFPFSDFDVRGLEDKELEPFQLALEQLNIRRMLPEISVAYLTYGFFCGSLVFDPRTKAFVDTMIHDALSCSVGMSPFFNVDPEITVNVGSSIQQFLRGNSDYNRRYLETLPESFRNLLRQGSFTLDPIATLFIPRRTIGDRACVSYLHRILPMYLIEKTLFRGTLSEAHRRQRAMTQITAGDDLWTPTDEELLALVQQYQAAETDPMGGWLATRNSVSTTDLRPGGDFWKWTDMTDIMVQYKLRALGISESFLSGDASYAAAESAYSTFLETQDSYRGFLTDKTIYSKIFPLVAVVNGLFKDLNKAKKMRQDNLSPAEFLYNSNSKANLKMPYIYWHKQLESDTEEGMFEMLNQLDEKGVPIPLKTWMAAAGVDSDSLLRDLKDDVELRKKLEQYTGKDTSHDQDEEFGDEEGGFDIESRVLPTLSLKNGGRRRVPILSRDFGDGLISESNRSGSGRKHIYNQRAARQKQNENLVKAAINARDPNYREFLKKKNIEKLGSATLPSVGIGV